MALINTKYGKIQSFTENKLEIFKGIHYVEAPIGELRFIPPIPK
jgi:carboxylesterase type B